MRQPTLLKQCREQKITHLKDGRPIDRTCKVAELMEALNMPKVKKGRSTWKPAQKLQILNKSPDFRYRWRENDPQNIQRALAEGWEFVNTITGIPGEHAEPGDGQKSNTSALEYRELTAMALPEEIAQARDEYFRERTDQQTAGLKDNLQSDLDKAAQKEGGFRTSATGTIVIE